jgi:DNA helicase HerA-like ATPase
LLVGNTKIFYQVFGGITNSEKLENKDESGFIEGEALQLGIWNNEALSFEKYGWIPQINTPLFKANTSDIVVPEFTLPEFKLGVIPNTTLPSVINLDDAVSHHIAMLGVTGAGKSFLAREIIQSLKVNTRVICIDFTGEWKKSTELLSLNRDNLDAFLTAKDDSVGLVELPTVSNTVQVIQSTENFISLIFAKAKEAYDVDSPLKICLVLEEAHTIVPEGTFLGVNDWDSKAVVNKMGQVALQGRKYGVGLMVLAQRTANVSKTVLTQCNTIICFQAFDETSFTFLGNYIGKDLVQALPNLKKYHAIVTGKAIKSNVPMIVNLEREL